ncbi:MAG: hypothetical protein HUJ67_03960, partial [Ruminiclostridium sp.]|nr:hypothetical protein [Ruminiclostridium sp.]
PYEGEIITLVSGGVITGGGQGSLGHGGGVFNEGSFTMYGGSIVGNFASEGGGVFNEGSFTMYGGSIIGNGMNSNLTTISGGGVHNDGTFTIYGGSITNNSAVTGGGVYMNSGAFTLSGSPVVSGNAGNNVYLPNGKIITVSAPLTTGASIGVATYDLPSAGAYVPITGTNDANYSRYFSSDNTDYQVCNENNTVKLKVKSPHEHSFTYNLAATTSTNDTVTAICTNADCDLADGSGGSVQVKAPVAPIIYTGENLNATLNDNLAEAARTTGYDTISYQYKATETGTYADTTSHADAGFYRASITVGTGNDAKTAYVEYEVEKAPGSGSVTMEGWTYGGTASNPVPSSNTNGTANVTYQYKVQDSNDSTYSDTKPTNAGNYTVKATFAATNNYNTFSKTANFTIAKANPTITISSMNGYTYGSTVSTPGVTGNSGNGTVTYYYNTTNTNVNGTKWEDITATTLNAGNYYLYAVVAATDNYNAATSPARLFTIGRANSSCTAPTARTGLTYTGNEQVLVTAGSTAHGTMNYALATNGTTAPATGWGTDLPTGMNAGTYYVWYKVVGDTNHSDSSPACKSVQ